MPPEYRYPLRITLSIVRDFIPGRKRSFAQDAARLSEGISRLEVLGDVPRDSGPFLYLVNHYSRPGFKAWWIAIALTSAAGRELHWPMTSAWTYPDGLRSRFITPLTQRVLARAARMYGFTLMPPMPPREADAGTRAEAVRRILRLARSARPSIGMAPEGMDSPGGRLMRPPSGAGRFIALLAEGGYTPVPVGACEAGDAFCLRFGKPFTLPQRIAWNPDGRDREISSLVMEKIGELL
jgi:1-acyl-sn-glycerol-3-phosphate acyltransferase